MKQFARYILLAIALVTGGLLGRHLDDFLFLAACIPLGYVFHYIDNKILTQ